jgi:hypothetical protein
MVMGSTVSEGKDRHFTMRPQCAPILLSLLLLVVARGAAAVPNLRGVAPQGIHYGHKSSSLCGIFMGSFGRSFGDVIIDPGCYNIYSSCFCPE